MTPSRTTSRQGPAPPRSPSAAVLALIVAAGCVVPSEGDRQAPADDTSQVASPIIFGADNRVEYGALSTAQRRYADVTAALFDSTGVSCSGSQCSLTTSPYSSGQVGAFSALPLCPGTRFAGQATGAFCTAFLIGPDLFATAGHCLSCSSTFGSCAGACSTTRVVFGFNADASGNNVATSIPTGNVYSCTSAQGIWTDTEDFAIFRVDRIVPGKAPLITRHADKLATGESLLVIGHPDGLPLKLATGGTSMEDLGNTNVGTSVDGFAGNSGSPVINAISGVVEAIHVRRPYWHYVPSGSCATPTVCSQTTGCSPNFGVSAWAQGTRFQFAARLANVPLHAALVSSVNL